MRETTIILVGIFAVVASFVMGIIVGNEQQYRQWMKKMIKRKLVRFEPEGESHRAKAVWVGDGADAP